MAIGADKGKVRYLSALSDCQGGNGPRVMGLNVACADFAISRAEVEIANLAP